MFLRRDFTVTIPPLYVVVESRSYQSGDWFVVVKLV